MDDPAIVRMREGIRHRRADARCPRGIGAALVRDRPERATRNELHHDEGSPAVLTDVMHADDAGVRQARHRPGFATEPSQEPTVRCEFWPEDLHGDGPVQLAVDGLETSAIPPRPISARIS